MQEIITQLQTIVQNGNFPPEKKKEYSERLEAVKGWQDEEMGKIMASFLADAEKDSGAIKTFFDQIDEVVKIFVLKGVDGLKEKVRGLTK